MIRKFRSIEAMNAFYEAQNTEDDPERLYDRLNQLLERSRRLAPGRPRGVFKFRTQAESNEFRERWQQDRIDRLRHQHEADGR